MLITPQNLLINSNFPTFYFTNSVFTPLKNPNSSLSSSHFQILKTKSTNPTNFKSFRTTHFWPLGSSKSDGTVPRLNAIGTINFDAVLSICEFLLLASSTVVSIIIAVKKPVVISNLGNRVFGYQFVLLVSVVLVGSLIRRRQWRRMRMGFSNSGGSGVNLIQRVEKLEDDLRSSATIIRVLSRHVEKLGIRFRVTRKSLKEPIAEAAALAQKNSEATRVLAAKEDNLEKELGEIQKVLLAMQEQQQKQFELIIAIGKNGKLWGSPRRHGQDRDAVNQVETDQIQASSGQNEANNDRA